MKKPVIDFHHTCQSILQNTFSPSLVNILRSQIGQKFRAWLKQNKRMDPNLWGPKDFEYLFTLYDQYFFDGQLTQTLRKRNITLRFVYSERATVTAGSCRGKAGPNSTVTMTFSHPIMKELASELASELAHSSSKYMSGGLFCATPIECLQLTLEHEMVHLLIELYCPEIIGKFPQRRNIHGQEFKIMVKNLFGQTRIQHELPSPKVRKRREAKQEEIFLPAIPVNEFVWPEMSWDRFFPTFF
jgi:hypothetical protein